MTEKIETGDRDTKWQNQKEISFPTIIIKKIDCKRIFQNDVSSDFIQCPKSKQSSQDYYRLAQPNWEYTIWKFQDFFAVQILREINF